MTGIGAHSARASGDVLLTVSVPAITKAAMMFDFILPVLQQAGYEVLRYSTDHVTTADLRFAAIHPPKLDINDSYADAFIITNANFSGVPSSTLRCFTVNDIDLTDLNPGGWALASAVRASMAAWSTDTLWPAGGTPDRTTVVAMSPAGNPGTATFDFWRLTFLPSDKYEAFVVASAYGFHVAAITGTAFSSFAGLWSRQFDPERLGRRISVTGFGPGQVGGTPKWPILLGAASGTGQFAGSHIVVDREGVELRTSLPVGSDLYPHDVCREVCSQSDLWLNSEPEDILQSPSVTNQQDLGVRIGIPDESEPCGELSVSTPYLAIKWIDEELNSTAGDATKGLHFHLFRRGIGDPPITSIAAGMGSISAGTGLFQVAGQDFRALGVKVGAYIANKTALGGGKGSVRVLGFTTLGATSNDTLVLTNIFGWGTGDIYEIYKAADHNDGFLQIGGHNLCVVQDETTPLLQTSGVKTLVLNDYGGEALNAYQANQNLVIFNNACAVVFDAALTIGTLSPAAKEGDWIEVTAGASLGTLGRVLMAQDLGSDNWRLVVNTTRGASLAVATPYKDSPWTTTDTITVTRGLFSETDGSQKPDTSLSRSGTITALSLKTSETAVAKSTGWLGRFTVLAVGTKDALNNDLRTTLQVDFGAPGVNLLLSIFPGAAIGARAKCAQGRFSDFASAILPNFVPTLNGRASSTSPYNTSQNVRQQKAQMRATYWSDVNPDEPNWQTKSLGAARVNEMIQNSSATQPVRIANDKIANLPHLMTATARRADLAQFDVHFDEGSGINGAGYTPHAAAWIALDKLTESQVGAHTPQSTSYWWMIGPAQATVPPGALATLNPPPPLIIMPPPIFGVPTSPNFNVMNSSIMFTMS